MISVSFVVFSLISLYQSSYYSVAVQVNTEKGILDGYLSQSRNGTEFYSFYSIPFAKPPVDEL